MSIIYNINDYRNKKEHEEGLTEFKRFFKRLGTWNSRKEEVEVMMKLSELSAAEDEEYLEIFPTQLKKREGRL